MEDLLPYYERELVMLRRHCREFAERFPKIAGRLQMTGDSCEDPHVERLIQAVSLLAARVSKRLDDDFPQFTEALLETLLPHYLRPFPSCSIVRVDAAGPRHAARKSMHTIPRGSELESEPVRGVRCKFKTVYDIVSGPVGFASASFEPLLRAPAGVRLPPAASATLSIVIATTDDDMPLAKLAVDTLRVFIDGEHSFCAALRDTLFLRTVCAHVELDDGNWLELPAIPLAPVGFAEQDSLIPFGARSHPAYRLLSEYFAFPEKFHFFDLDLAALRARLPADSCRATLHLGVAGLRPDSNTARLLRNLSPANFLLACSPVVNLFQRPGEAIAVTEQAADYAVVAHAIHPGAFEVYSIDAVTLLRQRGGTASTTEFRPLYSLRHGEGGAAAGHYWLARRDATLAASSPGYETRISLVDADGDPLAVERNSLSIDLTCTNRELPTQLKYGRADGDLRLPGNTSLPTIRLLRRPSQPYRFGSAFGQHWRLISHLTLNHHALAQQGLPALCEMLTLYDLPQSPISQRQIGGIVGLAHDEAVHWMRHKGRAALVHGLEVRLTLDEEAFVGSGMHLFVQVIDHFLGLYVQINSFSELVVLSKRTGEELMRCKPRSGSANLV